MSTMRLKSIFAGCLIGIVACNGYAKTITRNAKISAPNHPFPQFESMPHYTLSDGTEAIYPSASITNRNTAVKNYYNLWKANYLTSGPTFNTHETDRIRLSKKGSDANATVSEGQAYGMIITVMMAGFDPQAQETFNKLFWYVKAYPSKYTQHLMSWKVKNTSTPGSAIDDSAFDGDADIALALILASEQWGNTGEINYAAEANTIINAVKTSTIGQNSHLPLLGDWVNESKKHKLLKTKKECTEQGTKNQWTPRTSDFMLDNFHTFAYINPDQKEFWESVVNSTHLAVDHLQTQYSSTTGLLPDFTQYGTSINTIQPADPCFLEDLTDGDYSHNASRTPWRLGIDALLNNDPKSLAETRKISNWIMSHANSDIDHLYAGYKLNGTALVDYNSSAYTAPLGVAAMTGGSAKQAWLNNIFNNVKVFDDKNEDYYEHTLSLISMLVMTGNYWSPTSFQKQCMGKCSKH